MFLKHNPKPMTLIYLLKNINAAIGLVLVWRGIWYVLDEMDKLLFGGSPFWTAVVGVVVGLLLLYLPDKNLKELENL